jgi:alpha-1,2-mannosyltransferase
MSAEAGLASQRGAGKRGRGRGAGERDATRNHALLIAGAAVAAIAAAVYIAALATHPRTALLNGFDLRVYLQGAAEAIHHPASLYSWEYQGHPNIKFTYTPFAALVFVLGRALPFTAMIGLVAVVSVFALLATIWIAFRELGWRSLSSRAGMTLLLGGLTFWSEPVQRGLYLGQVELALMALVVWDLCQPDTRWWKGAATGIAAGIKLIPGLFIIYLLLTRRYKQAAVAIAAAVASVAIGFVGLPGTSVSYWFGGSFFEASRTGFVGGQENQSLRGMVVRFAGSVSGGTLPWVVAAVVVTVIGLAAAVVLHNSGRTFAGLMACGLVAQLISPISWDHHWVWFIPGTAVLIDAAVRSARGTRLAGTDQARAGRAGVAAWWYALAGVVILLFAAWPDFWDSSAGLLQGGLINYAPASSWAQGDSPAFAEYHWHGLQLIAGNLYVLIGLALLVVIAVTAYTLRRARPEPAAS